MNVVLFALFHVFLLLVGTFLYYAVLLKLLSRKGFTNKSLIKKILFGFFLTLAAWFIELVYLPEYFIGKLGFVTDPSIVSFVPTLVLIRELLFPFVLLVGFVTSIVALFRMEYVAKREHLKILFQLAVTIMIFGLMSLALLGILVP